MSARDLLGGNAALHHNGLALPLDLCHFGVAASHGCYGYFAEGLLLDEESEVHNYGVGGGYNVRLSKRGKTYIRCCDRVGAGFYVDGVSSVDVGYGSD